MFLAHYPEVASKRMYSLLPHLSCVAILPDNTSSAKVGTLFLTEICVWLCSLCWPTNCSIPWHFTRWSMCLWRTSWLKSEELGYSAQRFSFLVILLSFYFGSCSRLIWLKCQLSSANLYNIITLHYITCTHCTSSTRSTFSTVGLRSIRNLRSLSHYSDFKML